MTRLVERITLCGPLRLPAAMSSAIVIAATPIS
jgi:hypothetical protein